MTKKGETIINRIRNKLSCFFKSPRGFSIIPIPGPFDELLIIYIVLVYGFGYSPQEALSMIWNGCKYSFYYLIAPATLLLVCYMCMDSKPIGGPEDEWWTESKTSNSPGNVKGLHRIN